MTYNANESVAGDVIGTLNNLEVIGIDGYVLPSLTPGNLSWNGTNWVFSASSPKPYAMFFALMPGDNSATVAVGASVQFPQDGPANGAITRIDVSTFNLSAAGTYEVIWQVSIDEPGQLQLAINGTGLANTVVGRATGSSQIFGSTIITTTVSNSTLSVINPVGNSTALTITPIAGGASAVSATLTVKEL